MSGLPPASKTLARLNDGRFRGETNGSMSQSIRDEKKSILNKIALKLSRLSRSRRGGKKTKKGKTQKKRKTRKVRKNKK